MTNSRTSELALNKPGCELATQRRSLVIPLTGKGQYCTRTRRRKFKLLGQCQGCLDILLHTAHSSTLFQEIALSLTPRPHLRPCQHHFCILAIWRIDDLSRYRTERQRCTRQCLTVRNCHSSTQRNLQGRSHS